MSKYRPTFPQIDQPKEKLTSLTRHYFYEIHSIPNNYNFFTLTENDYFVPFFTFAHD